MRLYSLISIIHHVPFGTPISIKKVKTKLKTLQNKCVGFCLQLDNKARWNHRIQTDKLASC